MINFIKATVDLLLGFIDGAIDFLIDLLMNLLIEGIPELKTLFTPFDFDLPWDDLLNEHIAAGAYVQVVIVYVCVCLACLSAF